MLTVALQICLLYAPQDGMFKMWVPQNSTGSKVEQLLRWLPHSTVADLMHLVITEATSYWAG